ncbi:MAG: hypothetical protein SVS85_02295 [Candidatus Nanohaloarchaea archaeon]|nr:hypothetical protein [Candidatus Nanohaloarchaea archaeon]
MELPQKIHPLRRDPYWFLKYLKLLVLNLILVSIFAYGLIFYQDVIPQILKSYNLHYIVPGLILLYTGVWKTVKLEGKRKNLQVHG